MVMPNAIIRFSPPKGSFIVVIFGTAFTEMGLPARSRSIVRASPVLSVTICLISLKSWIAVPLTERTMSPFRMPAAAIYSNLVPSGY